MPARQLAGGGATPCSMINRRVIAFAGFTAEEYQRSRGKPVTLRRKRMAILVRKEIHDDVLTAENTGAAVWWIRYRHRGCRHKTVRNWSCIWSLNHRPVR